MKPNFLIIGAMKCATTTLHNLLNSHPDVFMSSEKEPNYFAYGSLYERGWPWYLSHFAGAGDARAIGEASTTYTKQVLFPRCSERIAHDLPDLKLIYIVRHPMARLWSHWLHDYAAANGTIPDFFRALDQMPEIVDTSLYWHQLQQYRRYYSDDRILVLFATDLRRSREVVVETCLRFLGVPPQPYRLPSTKEWHVTEEKGVKGPLLARAASLPGVRLAGRLAPTLRSAVARRLRRPLPAPPPSDEPLAPWFTDRIAEDAAKLLAYCNRPADHWRFETWGDALPLTPATHPSAKAITTATPG